MFAEEFGFQQKDITERRVEQEFKKKDRERERGKVPTD